MPGQIKNLDRAKIRLKKLSDEMQQAARLALIQEAGEVIEASKPLVPVDTGALKASDYITETEKGVNFGYSEEYALVVHEDLSANHPVGQAKYLEIPYLQRKRKIREGVEKKVKELVKKV